MPGRKESPSPGSPQRMRRSLWLTQPLDAARTKLRSRRVYGLAGFVVLFSDRRSVRRAERPTELVAIRLLQADWLVPPRR